MQSIVEWLVRLNQNHHVAYAIVTVVTMAVLGLTIGTLIELALLAMGIRYNKIDMDQH